MEDLKVVIGSDHAGYEYKEKIIDYLNARNIPYSVISGKSNRGILICGTGIGMSIAANKVRGIRAALCGDTYSARVSRAHNNANVLCLGERVIGEHLALDIVDVWLKTGFEGSRHKRRVDMIE